MVSINSSNKCFKKYFLLGMMVHTYNPNYSGHTDRTARFEDSTGKKGSKAVS
jgi:hypothetical protein